MLGALLREQELNSSPRLSSGQPMIFWAMLIILCSALLSATKQLLSHVEMQ